MAKDVFESNGFRVYPPENEDIFPYNSYYSFGAVIWKASKTCNNIKFCKEAKRIIVVDV